MCQCTQSCLTLCNPMDCSPPGLQEQTGSSVHGISQARILEWVTISSSRGFPHQVCLFISGFSFYSDCQPFLGYLVVPSEASSSQPLRHSGILYVGCPWLVWLILEMVVGLLLVQMPWCDAWVCQAC